jgi:hypothetical protein
MVIGTNKGTPLIARFEISPNCGKAPECHHCAKHFVATVEIEGFAETPSIEVRERDQRYQTGLYDSSPLECEIHFGSTAMEPSGLVVLQLGVKTVGQKSASEKPAVGLQFCKPGGMQKRFAWIQWDQQTMTAKVQLKIRARRIHQCPGEDRWEFRDDAGSGIRGKPHSLSMFRFSAFLEALAQCPAVSTSVPPTSVLIPAILPAYYDVRVWSKGNCPDRKKLKKPKAVKLKAEVLLPLSEDEEIDADDDDEESEESFYAKFTTMRTGRRAGTRSSSRLVPTDIGFLFSSVRLPNFSITRPPNHPTCSRNCKQRKVVLSAIKVIICTMITQSMIT